MTESGDKIVFCPYDKRHVMTERRYMWHLSMNCKAHVINIFIEDIFVKQREKKDDFLLCPYNSLHRIHKDEFEEHIKLCENRVNLYKIDYFI